MQSAALESFRAASNKFVLPPWPLVRFEEVVFICVAYLGALWAVVRVMHHVKDPFELKRFRLGYNVTCVAFSALTAWLFITDAFYNDYGFVCNNSFPHSVVVERSQWASYVFLLTKYLELTDTFVMALRKSFRQITFLHCYHHVSIIVVVWCYSRFSSGGDEWVPAALNSVVHVFMYSHYAAMTLGVRAPWKPLLTSMQLAQFCVIALQSYLSWTRQCGWADFLKFMQMVYMGSMLVLFGRFFYGAYLSPEASGAAVAPEASMGRNDGNRGISKSKVAAKRE